MYEERFKKWGLSKYLKRSTRNDLLGLLSPVANAKSSHGFAYTNDDVGEPSIHLNDPCRMDIAPTTWGIDSGDYLLLNLTSSSGATDCEQGEEEERVHTPESRASMTLSDSEGFLTSPSSDTQYSAKSGQQAADFEQWEIRPDTVDSQKVCGPYAGLGGIPGHSNPDSYCLEAVLQNVRSSCTLLGASHDGQIRPLDQVFSIDVGPQAQFWNELKHGIYFLKISCSERAFPALQNAGQQASGAFKDSPVSFILEILSTLSPVNTALCAPLRFSLLNMLHILARESFRDAHPVTQLCSYLRKDQGSQEVSERALAFMTDLLVSIHGISCEMSLKAELALIEMLRRSKQHERAASRARRLLSISITSFGAQSLSARRVARKLEHILIDQNDWQQALEVCFSIVGQTNSVVGAVQPRYHDEGAVQTMEDIAKIFDKIGDSKSCVSWLMQAANSALATWGPDTATLHIIDKLVDALLRSGKLEEAVFWRNHLVD